MVVLVGILGSVREVKVVRAIVVGIVAVVKAIVWGPVLVITVIMGVDLLLALVLSESFEDDSRPLLAPTGSPTPY